LNRIIIREAEAKAGLDTLRTLLREYGMHLTGTLGAENICMQQYEKELAALPCPYETLLLAFADEEAAGCVLLKAIKGTDDSVADETACELKRLWVRPRFRGLGVGAKLTEHAIAEARRRGYTAMYLDTVPSAMQAANRMYQTFGFKPIERYNANPVSNVRFFRRAL